MFKKRGTKEKGIRKRELDLDEEDVDTKDTLQNVKTLKLEQQFRRKKVGIDTKKAVTSKTSNKQNMKDNTVHDGSIITTLSGTRFHSTIDYGLKSKEEVHGEILERYIEDRLSSSNSNINSKNESDAMDIESSKGDLTKIIEEATKLNTSSIISNNYNDGNPDEDMRNAAAAVLAEVQLPIDSRIQNIKKTEEMLKETSHLHRSHMKSKDFEVMKKFTQKLKKR